MEASLSRAITAVFEAPWSASRTPNEDPDLVQKWWPVAATGRPYISMAARYFQIVQVIGRNDNCLSMDDYMEGHTECREVSRPDLADDTDV
jgi:hypothetical protein